MLTSEVLDLAADLIEQRGWAKGTGWNETGEREGAPLCLEGGIQAAMGLHTQPYADDPSEQWLADMKACPAYQAVKDYLNHPGTLYVWNDALGRTKDEVIAVLRGAAAVERVNESESVIA